MKLIIIAIFYIGINFTINILCHSYSKKYTINKVIANIIDTNYILPKYSIYTQLENIPNQKNIVYYIQTGIKISYIGANLPNRLQYLLSNLNKSLEEWQKYEYSTILSLKTDTEYLNYNSNMFKE